MIRIPGWLAGWLAGWIDWFKQRQSWGPEGQDGTGAGDSGRKDPAQDFSSGRDYLHHKTCGKRDSDSILAAQPLSTQEVPFSVFDMCVRVRVISESAHLFSMQIRRLGCFSHANVNWLVVLLQVLMEPVFVIQVCTITMQLSVN